jgi:hypothetical protein
MGALEEEEPGLEGPSSNVDKLLEQHKGILEACLANRMLDQLAYFKVTDSHLSAERINAARLKVYDGVPAFLLDILPTSDAERSSSTLRLAEALLRDFNAYSLGAVAGAGKTRQAFEHASLHFSLYFIVGAAMNNPGSGDMQDCVLYLLAYVGQDLEANDRLAEKQLRALVVARLLILNRLLSMSKEAGTVLTPKSFLLLQLNLGSSFKQDLCLHLYRIVRELNVTEVDAKLDGLAASVRELTGQLKIPIFVDEAHILALRLHEFPSRSNPDAPRPLLNEIYRILGAAIRSWGFSLVLIGSGLEMEDLEAVLTGVEKSGMGSPDEVLQLRISDGFYEREEHRRCLLKYTALSPQACNAIFRLLQGRFRFTIGFLNRYLQDPNGNWKKVLEKMQSVDPNSTVSALQTQLMRLGNSRASRIQQEGHEASVMEVVKYSVFNRLVGRRNFTWAWSEQRDAIRVVFAPLKEVTDSESGGSSAEICEPLSILAVLRAWYGGSPSRLCRQHNDAAAPWAIRKGLRSGGLYTLPPRGDFRWADRR